MTPVLYDCTVRHVRTAPLRHAFDYRSAMWFVDVDELPRSVRAADHVGDPAHGIRRNVESYLDGHGIDLSGGPIRLLTTARVLGRVFNPLSVFWCYHADGHLAAVIAEVHNTYGDRHCYLLHTDDRGRAGTAKAFYVSPFNDVSGAYRLSLPEPDDRLALTVALDRSFVASLHGRRRPATGRARFGAALRTLAVPLRIRFQGIRLYLRGLPVAPRTENAR